MVALVPRSTTETVEGTSGGWQMGEPGLSLPSLRLEGAPRRCANVRQPNAVPAHKKKSQGQGGKACLQAHDCLRPLQVKSRSMRRDKHQDQGASEQKEEDATESPPRCRFILVRIQLMVSVQVNRSEYG